VWYALFFAPVFSACCTALLLNMRLNHKTRFAEQRPAAPRAIHWLNAAIAVLLVSMIVPALPWIKPLLPLPEAYRARFAPNPVGPFPVGFAADPPLLLERETPVEAATFLSRYPPRGRLFNEMVFGSYLTWALYPQIAPLADPRIELYPTDFWLDYLRLSEGRADAVRTLEQRGFSDALLDPKLQPGLVKALSAAPGWHVAFPAGGHRDSRSPAILFRRDHD
jgi:hypothetical protein